VVSALHQRFPASFTLLLTSGLAKALQPSNRQQLASLTAEQRDRDEASRISRQRTYIRIAIELWLVGVLRNVEDGITALATDSTSQADGVAGLVDSMGVAKKKKLPTADPLPDNNPKGFAFRVLRELVRKKGTRGKGDGVFSLLYFFYFIFVVLAGIRCRTARQPAPGDVLCKEFWAGRAWDHSAQAARC